MIHKSWLSSVRRNPCSYEDKDPYNVSLVDLHKGPRLISNVIDWPPDQVKVGMPVKVVYEDNEGYTLPKFRRRSELSPRGPERLSYRETQLLDKP